MKRFKILLAGIAASTCLLDVGCKDEYKECNRTAPRLVTVGYDSSEIDSIKVIQYEKGSNFTKYLSEDYFLLSCRSCVSIGVDSFFLDAPNVQPYLREYESFDWRYVVLSDRHTINVTEAQRKINKTSIDHPNGACSSPIVNLKVDGIFRSNDAGVGDLLIKKP